MSWIWITWLLIIATSFAALEAFAFRHPERQYTLSRFIWTVGQKWPLSIALWGLLFGGLFVHFFWQWCPATMPPGVGG